MKPAALILGLAAAFAPQAALFFVQSWFVFRGEHQTVLDVAKYAGFLSLLFYILDGNSGLVHSIARNRFSAVELASAYAGFRITILLVLIVIAVPAAFWAGVDVMVFLALMSVSLILRLPWLDGPLDQRNLQALAVLLNGAWMICLCFLALCFGRIDGLTAGIAALLGSLGLAIVRLCIQRPGDQVSLRRPRRDVVLVICQYLATFGFGQIYGRGVLFLVGAAFSGPLPALVLYAKQMFNASGLAVNYIRRAEAAGDGAHFHLSGLRFSLGAQAAVIVPCALLVLMAGAHAELAMPAIVGILLWQLLERAFTTSTYILQRLDRPALMFACLCILAVCGSAGLGAGLFTQSVWPFLLGESLTFLVSVVVLLSVLHGRSAAIRATRVPI